MHNDASKGSDAGKCGGEGCGGCGNGACGGGGCSSSAKDTGLLLIRLGLAAVFIGHGLAKFSDLPTTVGFFGSLGLPALLAYAVAAGEVLGGLAMLLGLFTQWAGYLIALIMLAAMFLVKFKAGFLGGYEFDAMLLLAALGISLMGPGAYSLEHKMKK